MLANAAIVEAVAAAFGPLDLPHLVVDPVMVAKSGDRLLERRRSGGDPTPHAPARAVVTPNIPEAEVLTGMPSDATKTGGRPPGAIGCWAPRRA